MRPSSRRRRLFTRRCAPHDRRGRTGRPARPAADRVGVRRRHRRSSDTLELTSRRRSRYDRRSPSLMRGSRNAARSAGTAGADAGGRLH
jgi:hypothetical protein